MSQNPILIIQAPILNPHNSPYSTPYRPLSKEAFKRNPIPGLLDFWLWVIFSVFWVTDSTASTKAVGFGFWVGLGVEFRV